MTSDAIANERQATAWNGPEGAHWADVSRRRVPGADLTETLLDAAGIGRDDLVLEVGCGIGAMTIEAARRAANGLATGIDLSALMIDLARTAAAAAGVTNASFVVGDAEVHPFSAGSFDVVVSHFGAMFFGDPVAAFTNIARALRADGRLALVCPQAMDRCRWYVEPLTAVLGEPATPTTAPSAMFSLADRDVVDETLRRAGFAPPMIVSVDVPLWFGCNLAEAVDFFVGAGPVRAALERQRELTFDDVRARLASALETYESDRGVWIPGAHWLVTSARAP